MGAVKKPRPPAGGRGWLGRPPNHLCQGTLHKPAMSDDQMYRSLRAYVT
jgi:hypothetical protein